ncbi:MAG: GNAT family N-acetyltransferase [Proteobacteria bacterium]|nr:GNAT family N-acetyltransferase [Pseudomonadota bacterium]MBU1583682.1 GNAT family N-acetyltransferase [Pseudomonadota bacterium]MBU2628292.1 GNAT family N-acetyltransferase [Pseudomonadota bacterium]
MKISIYQDPDECRFIWEKMWPVKGFFDLWQVRSCFHDVYSRPLSFHVIEENRKAVGFLALCWNEEEKKYVQFPGESWHGKTWLEQNRIIAASPEILENLLESVPGSLHLRYLTQNSLSGISDRMKTDELGYIFFPGMYDFSFENYWQSFSGKFRKKFKAEQKKLEDRKITFRFNRPEDLDTMFRMNMASFGKESYFSDPRFLKAFENLASFLAKLGMLRITTLLIDGTIAAVDMGALFKQSYTLLAGGTNPDFPGVAKLINLHHMDWSCHQQIETVDFLCGDFNWKERFHLTPVPLYELRLEKNMSCSRAYKEMACA